MKRRDIKKTYLYPLTSPFLLNMFNASQLMVNDVIPFEDAWILLGAADGSVHKQFIELKI